MFGEASVQLAVLMMLLLAGCAQILPEDQFRRLTREESMRSQLINAYNIEDDSHPKVVTTLGIVDGYSCKLLRGEPPASYEEATGKLRLKALELGANGVVGVHKIAQPLGESLGNCKELVILRGEAVRFEK